MELNAELYSPKVTRYDDDSVVIRVNNYDAVRLLAALNALQPVDSAKEHGEHIEEDEAPTSITHKNFVRRYSIELIGEDKLDGDKSEGGYEGVLPAFGVKGGSLLRHNAGMHPVTVEMIKKEFPEKEDA